MRIEITDGGRKAAGFTRKTSDCVVRAGTIATGRKYQDVYDMLFRLAKAESVDLDPELRRGVPRDLWRTLYGRLGGVWTPTMKIGSGCKVHLRGDELPTGRIVCQTTRHLVAVVDGVVHDNHDSTRGGTRCVYGFYTFPRAVLAAAAR